MSPEKRIRLIQLLGMMGSDHDGEKLNAARLVMRLLGEEGLTWQEVFKGIPGHSNNSSAEIDRAYNRGFSEGHSRGYTKGLAEGHAKSPVRRVVTWVGFARELLTDYEDDLTDWEQGFLENYTSRGWPQPSPKQRAVFERIAEKLDLECPD